MLLKNLGNTTSSKVVDVRSSLTTTAYLEADPFTVTYANAGFPSITYNSTSGKYIASYSSDPVYTTPTTIATNFDAIYSIVDLSGKTDAQKAYNLAYYIDKYPQGGGIYFEAIPSEEIIQSSRNRKINNANRKLPRDSIPRRKAV